MKSNFILLLVLFPATSGVAQCNVITLVTHAIKDRSRLYNNKTENN